MNGDDPNDDLNDQERLIADAARRMQSRGVSDTDIDGFIQRAQERLAQNVADRPLSRGQLAKGMARGVAQGVTFNFADELEGLARGLLTDETRAEATEKVRGEQNEFRGKEPGLAFASEMAGSLVPGVGAARMAMKGVRPGARLAGRIAASGAGAGALAGAGAGEGGVNSRALPAAAGAAVCVAVVAAQTAKFREVCNIRGEVRRGEEMKDKILRLIDNNIKRAEDNVYRSRMQFGRMTTEQLDKEYGQSGRKCKDILMESEAAVKEAIDMGAWFIRKKI